MGYLLPSHSASLGFWDYLVGYCAKQDVQLDVLPGSDPAELYLGFHMECGEGEVGSPVLYPPDSYSPLGTLGRVPSKGTDILPEDTGPSTDSSLLLNRI